MGYQVIELAGGRVRVSNDPDYALTIIAGPCQLESREHALRIAEAVSAWCKRRDLHYVFKGSFDKANRTSVDGRRGVGMTDGLRILEDVRSEIGCPVTTDIHHAGQAVHVGQVVDLIQIPALMSRQTDLIQAAALTGKPINIKKGQFMAPEDMVHAAAKADAVTEGMYESPRYGGVLLTERGSTFGYHNLVVDMRGLEVMKRTGRPVIFDATHSTQFPSTSSAGSGGDRTMAPVLARAAVAVGVAGVFIETHEDPDHAPSDGPSMVRLEDLRGMLDDLARIDSVARVR